MVLENFDRMPLFLISVFEIGEWLLVTAMRPYIVDVTCTIQYSHNATLCDTLESNPVVEAYVLRTSALYLISYRLLNHFPATISGILCGTLSDSRGRKLPMLLPSVGSVSALMFYIGSIYAEDFSMHLILTGAFVQSLFGKTAVIAMAVSSHIADRVDVEHRTVNYVALSAMDYLGAMLGSLMAGALQYQLDLLYTLCISIVFHLGVVILVISCVKETVILQKDSPNKKEGDKTGKTETLKDNDNEVSKTCVPLTKKLYLLKQIDISEKIARLRNISLSYNGIIILMMFILFLIYTVSFYGEEEVLVLITKGIPFSWPNSWYAYVMALSNGLTCVSLFGLANILIKIVKLSDISVTVLGVLFKAIECVLMATAMYSWMIFLAIFIGSSGSLIEVAARSQISKRAEEEEIGKMFGWFSSTGTVAKVLGAVLFVLIYNVTESFLRPFVFIFDGFLFVVASVIVVIIKYASYKENSKPLEGEGKRVHNEKTFLLHQLNSHTAD